MKQLLHIPSSSYLFWGKANTASLKHCMNQYGKYFSVIGANQKTCKVFSKPTLASQEQENINVVKRFSSNLPRELVLMDFEVWSRPKFFRLFRVAYYFYSILKEMDDSFSFIEFNECATTALQVVTTLLSERRFSELEGLFTPECKEEIEKNLKVWPRDLISILAVKPGNISRSTPCDVNVFSDDNNKVYVEVRVIHYVWLKYSSKLKRAEATNVIFGGESLNDFNVENVNNLYMYGIYNSKYIREITKGVTDQWTINAINFKYYSDLLVTL